MRAPAREPRHGQGRQRARAHARAQTRRREACTHARTHETHTGRQQRTPGGAEQNGQRLVSRSRQRAASHVLRARSPASTVSEALPAARPRHKGTGEEPGHHARLPACSPVAHPRPRAPSREPAARVAWRRGASAARVLARPAQPLPPRNARRRWESDHELAHPVTQAAKARTRCQQHGAGGRLSTHSSSAPSLQNTWFFAAASEAARQKRPRERSVAPEKEEASTTRRGQR